MRNEHPSVPVAGTADQLANLMSAVRAAVQARRFAEAEEWLRKALATMPEQRELLFMLATVLAETGRLDEAIAMFERLHEAAPDDPAILNNLGSVLRQRGRNPEAIKHLRRLLAIQPDATGALVNLGYALQAIGHAEPAIQCGRLATRLRPEDADAHNMLGAALLAGHHADDAAAAFETALRLRPRFPAALANLALAQHQQGRLGDAVARFREALALMPENAALHASLGRSLLAQGELVAGADEYEWRWHGRSLAAPLWDGNILGADKTLLLLAEETAGDIIQLARFAPLLRSFAGRLVLACPAALTSLLAAAPGFDAVVSSSEPLPAADAMLPLLSVLSRCGATLETIPDAVPYLAADAARVAALAPAFDGDGLKVGLLWAAESPDGAAASRALDAAALAPLLAIPGLRFFSLQRGPAALGANASGTDAFAGRITDLAPQLADYDDVAAAMSLLDLVITVDDPAAHVAGALGRAAWVILGAAPSWNWLADRHDSPWYPSLMLFRRSAGDDGAAVVQEIARSLSAFGTGMPAAAAEPAPAPDDTEISPEPAEVAQERAPSPAAADYGSFTVDNEFPAGDNEFPAGDNEFPAGAIAAPTPVAAAEPTAEGADQRLQIARTVAEQGEPETAIDLLRGLVEDHPEHGEAVDALVQLLDGEAAGLPPATLNNLGVMLRRLGRPLPAANCFRHALEQQPDYALAYNNLGLALRDIGALDDAVTAHQRAVALEPASADGHNNLGAALAQAGHTEEAYASYQQAIELQPEHHAALTNLAQLSAYRGASEDAIELSRRAIALRPEHPNAHILLGRELLAKGELIAGSADYEWRCHADAQGFAAAAPLWDGQPLGPEATLLLRADEDPADAIQLVRFAPLLRRFAGRILLACPAALTDLMASAPGIDEVWPLDAALPPCDAQVPLVGLMHRLGATLEAIPGTIPYLAPDAARIAELRPLLAGEEIKVGLVWDAVAGQPHDPPGAIGLAALHALFDQPGVRLFSLQTGAAAAQLDQANLNHQIVDLSPYIATYADAAAIMTELDLVIAVDGPMAHLAGALDRPGWILLPADADWRWHSERMDSPWYPSLLLFRQHHRGAWEPVIEEVAAGFAAGLGVEYNAA